jgi:hypothetical protein
MAVVSGTRGIAPRQVKGVLEGLVRVLFDEHER